MCSSDLGVLLGFRDRLLTAGTVEGFYLGLFQGGDVTLPRLFIDQMAHVIVRNILDDVTDPFQARAGELFFREQTATVAEGGILLGDTEIIEMLATTAGMGSLGQLVSQSSIKPKQGDPDRFQTETVDTHWYHNETLVTV